MLLDLNFLIQSIIAMVLITAPPDPAKILLFNTTIEQQVHCCPLSHQSNPSSQSENDGS